MEERRDNFIVTNIWRTWTWIS